ncbi:rzcC protein, putative [Pseudooceanicola batsensis HTCC2597]|uniref:RTX toxin-activating lysine-acyltransferase n=1 Tax=Pseudooceanicola batsensis (strain ATCC BAA-863 / DSM 15984 / KCTC 12145 / HTCC2597) TaxID=252305 RepID=A3U2I2_PSEBH|nr:toxin-activating lysine-acyltransferase [Pseudooceanicola batsensis]EAQ01556.1 rzcC protein, putative [Pseudooceanicola batsensis HTCC2597]
MTTAKNNSAEARNGNATAAGKPANGVKQKAAAPAEDAPQLDPEVARKIAELRTTLRENFGKIVMVMMMVPRYRAQMLADLQHIVLDPMLQDRIAIAYPGKKDQSGEADMAGFAIWASVSEEVDARIREQIANGVFPVRLKSDEWNSGNINWLLDVIAPNRSTITTVIANFRQVVKDGELHLHPLITRLVDADVLEKMGARKASETDAEAETGAEAASTE